jgi:hypothetical protein
VAVAQPVNKTAKAQVNTPVALNAVMVVIRKSFQSVRKL